MKEDEKKVVAFYLKYALTVKVAFILLGIASIIGGAAMVDETEGFSILFGVLGFFVFVGSGIILENSFKWKAYVLKNSMKQ